MPITTAQQFYLWDHDSTLFPLSINLFMIERFAKELSDFIQSNVLVNDGGFQSQHRVFATKRAWFLRPTVKLDPVAEFFLYDFVYRNRNLFRRPQLQHRTAYGFRIVNGEPISLLSSYTDFKGGVARHRRHYKAYAYFDVAAYFNRIYHHDLVRWFEDAGGSSDEASLLGRFLRETASGRSIDCLPQGLYPAKMIGSAFLSFLETSTRLRASDTVRLMDDMWLFDDDSNTLVGDFLLVQSLLSERGLAMNDTKSAISGGYDTKDDVPHDLDEMKIQLLRKRRRELDHRDMYGDVSEEDPGALGELEEDEQSYLLELLKGEKIQEEDAELVLTLMRDHSGDVMEFLPGLIRDFPSLAKRLYYFCKEVQDKSEIVAAVREYVDDEEAQITEYQLFWFAKMAEDYLLKASKVGDLLIALYEHPAATDISRAKILEIPEKRFGLMDLREERLRTGHSDWLTWSAAFGSRRQPKAQRNQLLKYVRKSSPMNRLIGDFVEQCF